MLMDEEQEIQSAITKMALELARGMYTTTEPMVL